MLEQFGGHEFAAGLTLQTGMLTSFRAKLNEIAHIGLSENDFEPELQIDAKLDLNTVNMKFWKLLKQFEPFGPGNLSPIFVSQNIEIVGEPTIVGNGHLKMMLRQNGSGVFNAIGFNMHEYMPIIRSKNGSKLDIAYVLEENLWNGRKTIQMRLKDIHLD